MAALSTNRIAWTYHDDDGNTYRVAAQKALTDQNKLGGEAWNGTDPPRPTGYRMRRITVGDDAGNSRVLPVYSTDAPIITAGTTINVNVLENSTAMTSSGNLIPQEHLRHPVTRQSA